MKNLIVTTILQGVLIIGLLSIFILLIMPILPFEFLRSKPTAHNHILNISSSNAATQRIILARTNRLNEHGNGLDKIEVVAWDSGLYFLMADSRHRSEIQRLLALGVVFTACAQSLQHLSGNLKRKLDVIEGVQLVDNGKLHAESLKNNGYIDELA